MNTSSSIALGSLILNPQRERSLKNRHPWIFSGAVKSIKHPSVKDGIALYEVFSHGGEKLGTAYINEKCSLLGRMVAWGGESAQEALESSITSALRLRTELLFNTTTNAGRIIHGEADGVPGFVADNFNGHLVVQSATKGIDSLKPLIIDLLIRHLRPLSILERSHSPSRKEEGLVTVEQQLLGETPATVEFLEDGLKCCAHLHTGQKTGFFFDHREMRRLVGTLAKGRRVLNAFSYSGGFSLHAYRGGASSVTSVDISKEASQLCEQNLERNGFPTTGVVTADVFDYLREPAGASFDMVILDPPAFAKNKNAVREALKGYYEINRSALEKIPRTTGGLLLTCSCSYNVSVDDFRTMLFTVARDAQRRIRILQGHRLGYDHPVSIFHPEGEYLKSFLLAVD